MKAIHAIYEDGVFRPAEPVELPNASHVVFEPILIDTTTTARSLDEVYAILSRRFNSGDRDVASRHNEHRSTS